MNKTTKLVLTLLFASLFSQAQTYSTGTVVLSNTSGLEIQAKIDITNTEVTLTINAPSDRWFAIGFGGNGMSNVTDAFVYDSSQTFDKKIIPYNTPETDTNQDWNVTSDVITGTKREVIATRPLDTSENFDYVFTHSNNAIPVIWARGNGAVMAVAYHGSNKGATVLNPTVLGLSEQQSLSFVMYPNPVKEQLNIVLNSNITKVQYEIYSILGNKIKSGILNNSFNKINTNNLISGIYLLKIKESNTSYITRKFVKK